MITKEELKEKYINWLREEITTKNINETIEITSPLLDRFNDYLQIYVTKDENDKLRLSDDGYIIENLKMSGIDINTDKRKTTLTNLLKKYNVMQKEKELYVYATMEDFAQRKLNLLQAMLNVDDMFMLSSNRVTSIFLEDIKMFLKSKNIYSVSDAILVGKTGLEYSYDFIIQRTEKMPERLCKVINNGTRSNMESTLFAWSDTKDNREDDSKLVVFLNDSNKIDNGIEEAFKQYGVSLIKWSERENKKTISLLSA